MDIRIKLTILIIGIVSTTLAQEIAVIPKPANMQVKQGDYILNKVLGG